jgi:L-histidine Nalpha-methyltransferase
MSGAGMTPSRFADRVDPAAAAQFAADVEYYLMQQPRQLPSRYLYDPLGSALFEAICHLPWYRITRAEERLLTEHGAEVLGHVAPFSAVVELGSGSGEKLKILLGHCGAGAASLDVHLVDVSAAALESSARAVKWATGISVTTHQMSYEEGLRDVGTRPDAAGRSLVLFLGSNIGNYDPPGARAFVRGIRGQLRRGDALLIGADLVKLERELLLAYDDPLGVTAAFNRNLLVRINRELGADFDVRSFAHLAVWNAEESRIEMHLVSERVQEIRVRAADLTFSMQAGERIWTESSYKYRPDDIVRLLEPAGFRVATQWVDSVDRFALTLAEAI